MAAWIFTCRDQFIAGEYWTAPDVVDRRIQDQFWGIKLGAAYTQQLSVGDNAVFYVAAKQEKSGPPYDGKYFAGICQLATTLIVVPNKDRERLRMGGATDDSPTHGVFLRGARLFDSSVRLASVSNDIDLMRAPNMGYRLRGHINPLTPENLYTIEKAGAG
jgi:hypothetical protein